jgi:lipid A 3-O-deacylase
MPTGKPCTRTCRPSWRSALVGAAISCLPLGDTRSAEPIRIGGIELLGTGPSYIDLAAGVFDALGEGAGQAAAAGRIELRWGEKLFFVGPALGLMANTDGGVFGYAGLYADIAYGNFIITPLGGIGAYDRGHGKDLGGTFQFRIGIGLAYEFEDRSRLGLRVDHISNAHLHDRNPGEEEILMSYSIPIGALFAGSAASQKGFK